MITDNEHIIELFSGFTDEELIKLYEEESLKYEKIVKSSAIAREILSEYDLFYYDIYADTKKYYLLLEKYLILRKIKTVKRESKISLDDILLRINENRLQQISLVDKYLDTYDEMIDNYFEDEKIGPVKHQIIEGIHRLYNKIILGVKEKYQHRKKLRKRR